MSRIGVRRFDDEAVDAIGDDTFDVATVTCGIDVCVALCICTQAHQRTLNVVILTC